MAEPLERLRTALAERYRVERELGHGGMATVYLAEDLKHHRTVAIKVLDPELGAAIGPERFLREIEIAARLQHPNILALHDSGSADGLLYFVMPYVEGESLRDRIRRELQLPIDDAVRIAREVADALACAHEHGVVHRDIKPENILLSGGHATVADFGIARAVSEAAGAKLTQTGVSIGTPAYMSPEQAAGSPVDARSDLYALGCVLYEMLAGQPPFTGSTAESIIHQHLATEAPAVTGPRPSVPAELARILRRTLAKSPADRYASAIQLGKALAAASTTPAEAAAARARRPRATLAPTVIAASVAIVLVLSVLVWLRQHQAGPGRIESLAVLPLTNMSGDTAQEYFADGMTEELIDHLSKIAALRVISRTSVMAYKQVKKPVPQIARELHVDAVVEGSVLRAGDRVRITAELINARPEKHLWGDRYERELRDVLALQAEVAGAIAREVRVKLSADEKVRLAEARPVDPAAHDAYLKGRFFLNTRSERLFRMSIEQFKAAIRIDSSYAPAWAGLADAYYQGSSVYVPPSEAMPAARAAAEKAIELDHGLAEAHAALAVVRSQYDWEWEAADREIRRAIELNPNSATAHEYFATLLMDTGNLEGALVEWKRAHDLDPLGDYVSGMWAYTYYMAERYDEAIVRYRALAASDPQNAMMHWSLALCYGMTGAHDDAIAEGRKAVALGDAPFALACLARACALAGRRAEARQILDQLARLPRGSYVSPFGIAMVHAALGDADRVFQSLEKAYADRDENILFMRREPALKRFRSDPRFHDLLRRLKLEK